ncbi:MAG: twin-arginine translocase subunit TatC [Bacteroidaceae bacterium]|jgi:sec-independent protein translocase protein TatC|nr:twin-arginine translocase subunit TatC [Bacteroidaceae bacterium]
MAEQELTFWDHLDVLRGSLIKIVLVTVFFMIFAFIMKDTLFDIILAPKERDFITYRVLEKATQLISPNSTLDYFHVQLINTGLANQFLVHMKMALFAGFLCASPYIIYLLFNFISPALYENEKQYAVRLVGGGYVMFIMGVLLSYFVIFPFTFRFLGTYQVSEEVVNMIALDSYTDTFWTLSFLMGVVFEIPVICWLLAKFGLLKPEFMITYRRHAIVVILVAAAIITPTTDVFTLMLVAFPIWLLYEFSIFIVKHTNIPVKS